MNTAEYLNTLIECKEDMKAALIEKGAPPTGGLSTYADTIYDLYSDIMFSGLNWDEETRLAAIDSLQTYIEWTSRKVEELIQNEIASGRNGEECFNFDDLNNSGNYWGNMYGLTFFPSTDITSNLTSMKRFFQYQNGLLAVGRFNTSNVTDMSSMFFCCYNLISIPQMDTSKVTNMNSMFSGCENITSIPQMDTSKVTTMNSMFSGCENITSIPQMDTSKVTNMGYMFNNCYNLTDLGGFINIGNTSSFTAPSFSGCSKLTKASIMNVINNLYDRASAGYSAITLEFGATNLAKISDEEKAIATNKGWIIYG